MMFQRRKARKTLQRFIRLYLREARHQRQKKEKKSKKISKHQRKQGYPSLHNTVINPQSQSRR